MAKESQSKLKIDLIPAEEMAKKQREISVAEFFEKNRHLLGFDNKKKALLTTIKEAVDNSLDACEEARILPELHVEIIEMSEDRFRVVVEDNGPGIVKAQIPNIFAKLLYGSKFHTRVQSRGQQGIGISAAAMYGQLTTGKPIRITSKISPKHPAHYMELHINTATNKPEISNEKDINWDKDHGTRIELDLEASFQKGTQGVDEYIKQTAIVNPHCTIIYTNPKAEQIILTRVVDVLPPLPKPIKPHPYGLELGTLFKMISSTSEKTLNQFLQNDFSRVSPAVAKEICEGAGIAPNTKVSDLDRHHAEKLMNAIKETKIMAPPTDCIFPIGEDLLEKGLRKEIPAEYYVAVTRPPQVYRGNPFVIECALAYGGELSADDSAKILRFANRVPLQFQQGACASFKAITQTAWRSYGFNQTKGQLPQGPLVILIHIASVWAPFTSEAKEAIAHYEEIIKEMKLALQDAGRKLGTYVNRKKRAKDTQEKLNLFESYIPEVAENLSELTGENKELLEKQLSELMEKQKEFIQKTQEMVVEHEDEDEDDKKYRITLKDEEEDEE